VGLSLRPTHLSRYRDIAMLLVKHGRDVLDDSTSRVDADKLADDLESMGPTFVKLGQLLSTRADLLPPTYLDALSRLQDDVEPLSFAVIEPIVENELGVRISRAFESFESSPLASASIGQVHRAVLRDGRDVVVKVQRPDIRDRIRDDMAAIDEIASFADAHTDAGRRFGFTPMVDEFRRSLLAELDYRSEAANLVTLGGIVERYDRIVVPQPIDDYCTGRVLTIEYVDGRKVTELGPLAHLELDGDALADELFRAYLDQVLVHGFFHADPHPGNVLVTGDGRLALIDLGMVARVEPGLRDDLLKMLLALADGDGREVADICIEIGQKLDDFDRAALTARVVDLVARAGGATIGDLQAGAVIGELSRVSAECGQRAPSELTMLAKALLNLDEVARTLAPDFRPAEAIRVHTADLLRQRMLSSLRPGSVLSAAMDAREFAEKLPGRVNKVFDALADGRLTLNVQGIDEHELMRGIQKIANRVTMGLVLAALIVGAAMTMRVTGVAELWGYPALSVVLFLLAVVGGLALVVSIFLSDLPQRRRR
jgi:predicted unusual protein kinase regulating ubiquinone biosynthesis (AarF/ABC1/UbiB family)